MYLLRNRVIGFNINNAVLVVIFRWSVALVIARLHLLNHSGNWPVVVVLRTVWLAELRKFVHEIFLHHRDEHCMDALACVQDAQPCNELLVRTQ